MIFKRVIKSQYCGACRYTGYVHKSIRLHLECGHEQYRKRSAGTPGKARCPNCEQNELKHDRFMAKVRT